MAAVAFAVSGWLIVPHLLGERSSPVRPENLPPTEYICRETRQVFRLPPTAPELPNPKTGRPTLVQAVYDPRTKSWKPGPPLDVRQRAQRGPSR
jgi:hypothetical protein